MTEQTKKIIDLTRPDDRQTGEPVRRWQASVRATHHFLREQNIPTLESELCAALVQIPEPYAFSVQEKILGFIVLADGKAVRFAGLFRQGYRFRTAGFCRRTARRHVG